MTQKWRKPLPLPFPDCPPSVRTEPPILWVQQPSPTSAVALWPFSWTTSFCDSVAALWTRATGTPCSGTVGPGDAHAPTHVHRHSHTPAPSARAGLGLRSFPGDLCCQPPRPLRPRLPQAPSERGSLHGRPLPSTEPRGVHGPPPPIQHLWNLSHLPHPPRTTLPPSTSRVCWVPRARGLCTGSAGPCLVTVGGPA